jgi:hypothetical protein
MVDVDRHQNITLLTFYEMEKSKERQKFYRHYHEMSSLRLRN